MLGHDKPAAEKKLEALVTLWKSVEPYGGWTPEAEATAISVVAGFHYLW